MDVNASPAGDPQFRTTHWSLVATARAAETPAVRAALDALCQAYWVPLYAFARRSGYDVHTAQDLVQGFLAEALEKGTFGEADPDRGRFRTFLLAAFRHHAGHERERAAAQKRGGDRVLLSLDFDDGERRYALEPAGGLGAEAIYERRWALTLLDRALERLAAGQRSGTAERAERFEALRPFLGGGRGLPYREVGLRLGMSETAVKVAVHRLRAKFRDCLRGEIADTVSDPELVDDEIARLMEAVRGS